MQYLCLKPEKNERTILFSHCSSVSKVFIHLLSRIPCLIRVKCAFGGTSFRTPASSLSIFFIAFFIKQTQRLFLKSFARMCILLTQKSFIFSWTYSAFLGAIVCDWVRTSGLLGVYIKVIIFPAAK